MRVRSNLDRSGCEEHRYSAQEAAAMKIAIRSVLSAAALTLGACAHASPETAALTPDQMRAELTAISKEIGEINTASREDYRLERVEARMTSFAQRADPSFHASPTDYRRKLITTTVPYTRLRALNERRDQLLAQLAMADLARD
jgi:hypothetical protein